MSEFAAIIAASYTPQELFALRKIETSHWLMLLERGDPEAKAKARAFWSSIGKP